MKRIAVQVAIQPGRYMIAWLVQLVPHSPRHGDGAFLMGCQVTQAGGLPLVGSERTTEIGCPSFTLTACASAYFKVNKFPENGTPCKGIWEDS
jgi:hypothetical protein